MFQSQFKIIHYNIVECDYCAEQLHILLNLCVRIGWINQMLWFGLTSFPNLAFTQNIMVIQNRNWMINTIDKKCPWCRRIHNCYPLPWGATNTRCRVPLHFPGRMPYAIFVTTADIFGSVCPKTCAVSLSTWVRKWLWQWDTMGNS